MSKTPVSFNLNGRDTGVFVDGGANLLDALRRGAGDLSPKYGCGQGTCGTCTVLIDGEDHQDDDNNSTSSTSKVRIPLTQEEYTQFLIDTEHQRDIQTTQRLAQTILNKSEQVDNLVAGLPGMHRTRDMQMERIEELLVQNHQVAKELDEVHVLAKERLQEVRKVLGETTFLALGVEEE